MPKTSRKNKAESEFKALPQWHVVLHNDDNIAYNHVVLSLTQILGISEENSVKFATEAQDNGKCIVLTTHLERAELIKEKFDSCLPQIPSSLVQAA